MSRKAGTKEAFIKRAKEKHGNRYGYDEVDYIDSVTHVLITCKKHGPFYQTPAVHLLGKNCFQCSVDKRKGATKSSVDTESFIQRAKEKHGDRYDYSKTVYRGARNKVTIVCKEHGEFEQLPYDHTSGCGCPQCGLEKTQTGTFLKKARKVHGTRYDYSKVSCKKVTDEVIIGCKAHGDFKQRVINHLAGSGCTKCVREKV